jgi:hypothetical protein
MRRRAVNAILGSYPFTVAATDSSQFPK